MTELQKKYLTLREQGRTIREIARMMHKSPASVSATLQRAQRSGASFKGAKRCKYSDSCFACPLPDCARSGADINHLPVDFDYIREMDRTTNNECSV